MSTAGTDARRVRGIPADVWEDYRAACAALYGTTNRSDVIRKHVEETIEQWRATYPESKGDSRG